MTDPTSDSYNLADHPDEVAELLDLIIDTYERKGGELTATLDVMRAAAIIVRHHANLLDAIGPPMRVMDLMARGTTMDAEGDELAELLSRIYAAAVSPPPAPTTCPTCLGDGVVLSGGDEHDCRDHGNEDGCFEDCPNSWHQAAT
jgi:hypothetical protein